LLLWNIHFAATQTTNTTTADTESLIFSSHAYKVEQEKWRRHVTAINVMEYILRRIHSIFRVRIEKIQILDPDIVEWGVRCDPHTLIIPTPGDWEWLMADGSWLMADTEL
jgi:hypothetical protein